MASDLPTATFALTEALRACAVNPADQMRLLTELADFYPPIPTPLSTLSRARAATIIAVAALCRRAAIVSLARAAAAYQPSSYTDAVQVMTQVVTLLDTEIQLAGDAYQDASVIALSNLRATVVADLTARGATLAPVVTVTLGDTLPAPVAAQRLYQDGSRDAELIARADPIHPAFMPQSFEALAF